MRVILIRHGDAEAEAPEGLEDEARSLMPRARIVLPAYFESLAPRLGVPDVIFTSPLVRTVQTATLLAQALRFEGPVRAHRHLYPDAPVGAVEAMLTGYSGKTVVVVGHQPTMGVAAAHFLGMSNFGRPVVPGMVIAIERPQHEGLHGRLLFCAAPGQGIVD